MRVDVGVIKRILAANNISLDASQTEIRIALSRSGYTEEEIQAALMLLGPLSPVAGQGDPTGLTKTPPPVAPSSFIPQSSQNPAPPAGTPASPKPPAFSLPSISFAPAPEKTVPEQPEAPVGLYERIAGPVLALLIYIPFVFYLLDRLRLSEGISTTSAALFSNPASLLYVSVVPVLFFILAWFIGRAVNRTATFFFQLSTIVAVYALLWFGLLFGLTKVLQGAFNGSPVAGVMGMVIGLVMVAAGAVIAFLLVLAPLLLLLFWKRKTPKQTRIAPLVVGIIAIGFLIYFSGILLYPARALNMQWLCVAVAGESSQTSCRYHSFTGPEETETYDVIYTAVPLKEFSVIGGRFYALSETGGGGTRNDIYIDGVRDTRYKHVRSPVLDIGGKAVFEAVQAERDEPVIVYGDEELSGYIGFGSLTPTKEGGLAYVGVKEDRTTEVISNGRVFGSSFNAQGASTRGIVPLPGGSILYSFWRGEEGTYVAVDDSIIGGPYSGVTLFEHEGQPAYTYTLNNEEGGTIVGGKEVSGVPAPEQEPGKDEERLIRKEDGFYLDGKYVAPAENAYHGVLIGDSFIIGGIDSSKPARMVRGFNTPWGFIIAEKGLISPELRTALESITE